VPEPRPEPEYPTERAAALGGVGVGVSVLLVLLGVWLGKVGFHLVIAGAWLIGCLITIGWWTFKYSVSRNAYERAQRKDREADTQRKDEKLEPYREEVRRFVYDLIDEYRWLLETPWEHQKKWADHPGEVTTESGKAIESGGGYVEIIDKWKDLKGWFNELRKRREFASVLQEIDEDLKGHSATRLPHGKGVMDLWEAQMKLFRYARHESTRPGRRLIDLKEEELIDQLEQEAKERFMERERSRQKESLVPRRPPEA